MSLVDRIKKEFDPHPPLQVIAFTPNGFLVESCNTFLDMEKHRNDSLYKVLPFLEDHRRFILNLSDRTAARELNHQSLSLDDGSIIEMSGYLFKREGFILLTLMPDEQKKPFPAEPFSHNNEVALLKAELEKLKTSRHLKAEYFYKIAHDIKLPLTEIVGTTYMLQNYIHNEKGQEYLKVLTQSALTLDKMLKDLLEFSRMESTDISFEKKPFSIEEVLWLVVRAYDYTSDQKNIPLYLRIDRRIPPIVIGDPERLTQIVYNLIDNAMKFTDKGNIEIWVNVTHLLDASCGVEFSVTDTGIGIPADKIDSIFEAYHQANEAEHHKKGIGLGLSIVKQLVELQGGSVYVNSQVGEGTVFRVKLEFLLPTE